jgi:hypothetical protein
MNIPKLIALIGKVLAVVSMIVAFVIDTRNNKGLAACG